METKLGQFLFKLKNQPFKTENLGELSTLVRVRNDKKYTFGHHAVRKISWIEVVILQEKNEFLNISYKKN